MTDAAEIAFRSAIVAIIVIALISTARAGFYVVHQQTKKIVERLGKFHKLADPGLHFKIPFLDRLVYTVEMRVQQLLVTVETKTKDNVFVKVPVAVQYRAIPDRASDTYYQLANDTQQLTSYVLDVVRAKVPTLVLDEVFEKKDDIAKAVKEHLDEIMRGYGWEVISALVTDVDPAANVKAAMNEIQAQTRLQVAAQAKGEANKVLTVKNAEADAESKRLQGEGIANQRKAIVEGLKDSVKQFQDATGVPPREVMQLVLMTQYFDTMKEIGISAGSKVILLPHSPGGLSDVANQMQKAIIAGEEATSG
ncbi:MAG TPA: SPFH domain-containing protein [Beijerinckiaceae bacterium]|nr:SPFH domain-containing protein [Beijerinckiaceae bacterium]HVB89283.1 SPFH domain-containing protein [Beijerinckiaceae bacterium]